MSVLHNISLFIPHVFPNFDKEYVANSFKDIGEIDRIDFVLKVDNNNKHYNAVYIHFNKWFFTTSAVLFYKKINLMGSAKFYHDDKWYWIVLPNTGKKHTSGERKSKIDLGKSNVVNKSSNLDYDYASDVEIDDINIQDTNEDKQLDEIEAALEEEDSNLVCIDARYVQSLEEENIWLKNELFKIRVAILNLH